MKDPKLSSKGIRQALTTEIHAFAWSANVLQSTSSFTEPRDLDFLPAFIKAREYIQLIVAMSELRLRRQICVSAEVPQLPKRLKKAGTPSLIVLSPSGIRAADVVRSLKSVRVPEGESGEETGKPPGEVGKVSHSRGDRNCAHFTG